MPYFMLENKALLKQEKNNIKKQEKIQKKKIFKEKKEKQKNLEKIKTINPLIKKFILPKI